VQPVPIHSPLKEPSTRVTISIKQERNERNIQMKFNFFKSSKENTSTDTSKVDLYDPEVQKRILWQPTLVAALLSVALHPIFGLLLVACYPAPKSIFTGTAIGSLISFGIELGFMISFFARGGDFNQTGEDQLFPTGVYFIIALVLYAGMGIYCTVKAKTFKPFIPDQIV
jgi:hypothetical protein